MTVVDFHEGGRELVAFNFGTTLSAILKEEGYIISQPKDKIYLQTSPEQKQRLDYQINNIIYDLMQSLVKPDIRLANEHGLELAKIEKEAPEFADKISKTRAASASCSRVNFFARQPSRSASTATSSPILFRYLKQSATVFAGL